MGQGAPTASATVKASASPANLATASVWRFKFALAARCGSADAKLYSQRFVFRCLVTRGLIARRTQILAVCIARFTPYCFPALRPAFVEMYYAWCFECFQKLQGLLQR